MTLPLVTTADPCTRCGACCKDFGEGGLPVTPAEFRRLSRIAKREKKHFTFRARYFGSTEGVTLISHYSILTAPCVFYSDTAGCTIYKNRPSICRAFPVGVLPTGGVIFGKCEVRLDYERHLAQRTLVSQLQLDAATHPHTQTVALLRALKKYGVIVCAPNTSLPAVDIDLYIKRKKRLHYVAMA